MIIDTHSHACGDYLNADSIIEILDKNKTDKTVLCPGQKGRKKNYNFPNLSELYPNKDLIYYVNTVISIATKLSGVSKHIEEQNYYVYTLCQNKPDRLLQKYWVKPNNKNIIQDIENDFLKYKFKLLKLHQCWTYFKFTSTYFKEITDWALNHNMPIFIHIKSRKDVLDLIEIIKERQDSIFIIAHLIGIEEFIKHFNILKNVYFEISTPQLIPIKKLNLAFEKFGSEKLLLGSDTPYGKDNLKLNIERVNRLNINQKEKDNILGNNIKRILNL